MIPSIIHRFRLYCSSFSPVSQISSPRVISFVPRRDLHTAPTWIATNGAAVYSFFPTTASYAWLARADRTREFKLSSGFAGLSSIPQMYDPGHDRHHTAETSLAALHRMVTGARLTTRTIQQIPRRLPRLTLRQPIQHALHPCPTPSCPILSSGRNARLLIQRLQLRTRNSLVIADAGVVVGVGGRVGRIGGGFEAGGGDGGEAAGGGALGAV